MMVVEVELKEDQISRFQWLEEIVKRSQKEVAVEIAKSK